ncbi:MAG TPA: glycerophosphodiester phosphodiesterase [Ktedonobacteraceae bacterium]|nr:glycerophosphodiester phosphodiesterase [Ktedonobacteraceae bacterium]
MNQNIHRVAHRGGAQLAPENTFAAFLNALTLPIDAIELDVHLSRDGHVVVFHDNHVHKRTKGHGNLLDLDLAYLRRLDAAARHPGGWPEPQQIPTLSEVLELAKGRVQVYIEIKTSKRGRTYEPYPYIAEKVVEMVHLAGMLEQVLLISFDWMILPEIKSLEPTIETGMIVSNKELNPRTSDGIQNLIEKTEENGCQWINMDYKLFTTEILQTVHTHGLKLGLWTVNAEADILHFAAAGVDSLTSDRPDLFSVLTV